MVLLGEHYYLEVLLEGTGWPWIWFVLIEISLALAQCLTKSSYLGLRSWKVHGKRLWVVCGEDEGCRWYSKEKSEEKMKWDQILCCAPVCQGRVQNEVDHARLALIMNTPQNPPGSDSKKGDKVQKRSKSSDRHTNPLANVHLPNMCSLPHVSYNHHASQNAQSH